MRYHIVVQLLQKRFDKTSCLDCESNTGPSDLQSDALPTELSRLCFKFEAQSITELNNAKRVSFIGKQWRGHHGAAAVSLFAHVSAITLGTRDKCLPFFIRRVFPDPSIIAFEQQFRKGACSDSRAWPPPCFFS